MSGNETKNKTTRTIIIFIVAIIVGCALACGLLALLGIVTPGNLSDYFGGTPTPQPAATAITVVIPTPAPGVPTVTAMANVDIRTGPGTEYPVIGYLEEGQSAEVVGVSTDLNWWVIKVPEAPNSQGWVSAQSVTAENTDNLPVIQSPPVPTPTPQPPVEFTGWKGEYFDNRDLKGDPVLVRDDAEINFEWDYGSPAPEVPSDNFSVRWTITQDVPAATYRFSVWVDDGARVWVDDRLIINGWVEGPPRKYIVDVNLAGGRHDVRVEFFESQGNALMSLQIGYLGEYPDWKAEYYDNPTFAGNPVVIRNETEINHNWGTGSPVPGVNSDNFSVTWTRRAYFDGGYYIFQVDVAGGVHVWMADITIIDSWSSAPLRTLTGESGRTTAGWYDLRVDYFKRGGDGQIRVVWGKKQEGGPPRAVISGTNAAAVGQAVNLNARSSTAAEGRHLVSYDWAFGDGATAVGVDVTHVYHRAGSYDVTLTVTDDIGQQGRTTATIRITGGSPTPTTKPTATAEPHPTTKPTTEPQPTPTPTTEPTPTPEPTTEPTPTPEPTTQPQPTAEPTTEP